MITPCSPVRPSALHTSKKPSILLLAPPMACTTPAWFTEPVTAMLCRSGMPDRLDRIAYNSVEAALSPSTPAYDCSKVSVADILSGTFCAKRLPSQAASISAPLSWMGPLIFTSRSMLTTPARPRNVRAVTRDGMPNW